MRNLPGLSLLMPLFASACTAGEPASEGGATVRRDSAGVSIVESPLSTWENHSPWTIEPEPVVSIGVVDGDGSYLFSGIVAAYRLADGQIVVADRRSAELRYYSADGVIRGVSGGMGEGPGHFLDLGMVNVIGGDTVAVIDAERPRLTFLSGQGDLLDVVDVSTADGVVALPVTIARSGAVLSFGMIPLDPVEQSHSKHSVRLYIHSSASQAGRELLSIPWVEFWRLGSGAGGSEPIPFAPRGSWAPRAAGFVTGAADTTELLLWSDAGELQSILRWGAPAVPIRNAERDRYREHRLASVRSENARRSAERALGELPWPQYMPAYESLLVDDLGDIWVERYRVPWETELRWTVIDSAGVWLGDVVLPDRFRPTHIGGDFMLGVWQDEDGVEFVHEYRFRRLVK